MAEDAAVTHEERHPLTDISSQIGYWERWKDRWEKCTSAEERYGLLHIGFMVRANTPDERDERILFYIACADSWHYGCSLHRKEDQDAHFWFSLSPPERPVDMREMRRVVARKAFEVLCQNVLKNTTPASDYPSWCELVRDKAIMEKLFWFFRHIQNLGHSYDAERDVYVRTAHRFVEDLAEFVWRFRYFGKFAGEEDYAIQEQLRAMRPRIIEILWASGKLMRLLTKDPYDLDEACFAKLEELAFRKEQWLPTNDKQGNWTETYRRPASLEEAHFAGSSAAIVLTHRRIVAQEEKRFEKLRELSERRDELEREQATLQPTA